MNERVTYKIELRPGESLIETLRQIPFNATHLDLSSNSLGEQATEDLIEAFAVLRDKLVSIDLSGNKLFNKSGAELKRIFEALPAWFDEINLSKNELGNRSGFGLGEALAGLPAGLRIIDLSDNLLSKQSAKALEKIFRGLGAELHSINLSGNSLVKRTDAEPALIWGSLPANVHSIYLIGEDKIHPAKLAQICFLLPSSLNRLFLNELPIERKELAILKAEGELFHCINREIGRLDNSRDINALRNIKELFKDLPRNEMAATELPEKWDNWKDDNQAVINKKRSRVARFFRPNRERKIQTAVEKINPLMNQVIDARKNDFNKCPQYMKSARSTLTNG